MMGLEGSYQAEHENEDAVFTLCQDGKKTLRCLANYSKRQIMAR